MVSPMREVTDPALLAQLEGGNSSASNSMKEVTDPELLKQLESSGQPNSDLPQDNFNPSFASKLAPNILSGLAQMGHGVLNTPSNIANYAASKGLIKPETAAKVPRQQDYDFSSMLKLPNTTADKIVQGIAQYSPALLSPGANLGRIGAGIEKLPYAGKTLANILSNAIPVSAFGATQSDQPLSAAGSAAEASIPFSIASSAIGSTNPIVKALARAGLGAIGGYGGTKAAQAVAPGSLSAELTGGGLGALLGLAGQSPSSAAKQKMLEGVNPDNVSEKLAASRRLGLDYITPAEASGNPFAAANQGAAGKTDKGSQMLYAAGQNRIQSEKNAINDLYDTIFDKEKLSPQVNALYKQAHQAEVPKEELNDLKGNEILIRP
jgi:hypothetical protein